MLYMSPEKLHMETESLLYSDLEVQEKPTERPQVKASTFAVTCTIICCLVLSFIGGTWSGRFISLKASPSSSSPASSRCINPATRHEWRSLSAQEQDDYLSAVECLHTQPSRLGLNQSLYDDFPYVHYHFGEYSHHSAAFLSWHRYFIHVYERALKEQCGYKGHLTYWDWSLDWTALTSAPIWSAHSFGTNGSASASNRLGEKSILGGTCVADGRFAHTRVQYLDKLWRPHCLTRGFIGGERLIEKGTRCKPAAIDQILSSSTFEEFFLALENGPHDAIPQTIQGDFKLFTAPTDPVFFLHHAQLDRLWRLWQEKNLDVNLLQYNGAARHDSTEEASLEDLIPMGSLMPDTKVRDIIDTRSGMLCYN